MFITNPTHITFWTNLMLWSVLTLVPMAIIQSLLLIKHKSTPVVYKLAWTILIACSAMLISVLVQFFLPLKSDEIFF